MVIGTVAAGGYGSTSRNYVFTDAQPPPANSFYRVVEYDDDLRVQYTAVAGSQCGIREFYQAWPNPCTTSVHVSLYMAQSSAFLLKVYDQGGALIDVLRKEGYPGINEVEINMRGKAAGAYYVTAEWNDGRERRQFFIVKE